MSLHGLSVPQKCYTFSLIQSIHRQTYKHCYHSSHVPPVAEQLLGILPTMTLQYRKFDQIRL